MSTNLSKIKRENYINKIEDIKKFISNTGENSEYIHALNSLKKELNEKKLGIVFEEHEEGIDLKIKNEQPILTEYKNLYLNKGGELNFLLEGDNLAALTLLKKTHKEAIDIIYIDPPYNTGNTDFIYDDDYVEKEDGFKHSKWLSFMKKRLELAYELLSNDGVIFVSIDDNEHAVLKVLMDEVFNEDNYVLSFPRQTKKSGKTTGSFSKNHDYVLVYTKHNKNVFVMDEHVDENYKHEDEFVKTRGKYKLNQTLDYDSLSYSQSLDYPLEIEGEVFYPGSSKELYEQRQAGNHKRADWAWRWNKELFKFGYENGFIVIKRKKDGSARIYTKTYLNATIAKSKNSNGKTEYYIKYVHKTKPMSSIDLTENKYSNDNAKKDLALFDLSVEFDYSKPVDLIKKLISSHYNENAIVLDFFAGSGTTGQAVLELNQEKGGNRKFILCTNNQKNICHDITYKRISSVIQGFETEKESFVELLEEKLTYTKLKKMDKILNEIELIKSNGEFPKYEVEVKDNYIRLFGVNTENSRYKGLPARLKFYKIEFLTTEQLLYQDIAEELVKFCVPLIELKKGIELGNTSEIRIIESDEELEGLLNSEVNIKELYISNDVLIDGEIETFLKKNNIKMHYIPSEFHPEMER